MRKILYTIGYTLFQKKNGIDVEALFNTLRMYSVNYIVDVRSVPYSRQFPLCNADNLRIEGKKYGIPYIHMPEIGAKANYMQDVFSKASDIFFEDIFPISKSNRPEKTELKKEDEIVDFRKFRNDDYFLTGLKRIESAYEKDFTLALMCSEKRPIDCHRYFLISKALEQRYNEWLDIEHIVSDKNDNISTVRNDELNSELEDLIFKRSEIAKLDVLNSSFFEEPKINNYFGHTQQEKINDFCDRYWNLMHGWKKEIQSLNNKFEDYD